MDPIEGKPTRQTEEEFADPKQVSDSGTLPSAETVAAEARNAAAVHEADRPATSEEDNAEPEAAAKALGDAYRDALARGASQKGEGHMP